MRLTVLFLGIALALPAQAQTNASVSTRFLEFAEAIKDCGWSNNMSAVSEDPRNGASVALRGWFQYTVPGEDGYYPKLECLVLGFEKESSIPNNNGNLTQAYKDLTGTNAFPLHIFYGRSDPGIDMYLHWSAFRVRKTVIVFCCVPTRQETDFFMNYLTSFLQVDSPEELALLRKQWRGSFDKEKDTFLAGRKIQAFLKREGLYDGNADGMFGEKSKKAFQTYLKNRGYYTLEIDGRYGKGTRDAIRELQKSLGVKVTGNLTLEMADAMEKKQQTRAE